VLDHQDIITAADGLEPLPASLSRLASVVADPSSELVDVVEVLGYDQALAARVLRNANSAASGALRPIVNVREAVIRLGRGRVLSLAVGVSVGNRMNEPLPEYGHGPGDLWRMSVLGTVAAGFLSDHTTHRIPPETVTASLLADVGKLVVRQFLDADMVADLDRAEKEGGLGLAQAETELFGVHHGEVGALVAQHWKLPEGIVSGILYHHSPDENPQDVCYATYLACHVAETVMGGPDAGRGGDTLERSLRILELEAETLGQICETTAARFEDISQAYR